MSSDANGDNALAITRPVTSENSFRYGKPFKSTYGPVMPQIDSAEHYRALMERKLKEANEIVDTASGKVLPILIFTLIVAWFLGLETQITPLFQKANEPNVALAAFEGDIKASSAKREALAKEIGTIEKRVAEERRRLESLGTVSEAEIEDERALQGQLDASLKNFYEHRDRETDVRKASRDLQKRISDTLNVVKEQKAKAENVEFKLPILELKVPRIAAPLVWCVVALGTVLYILHLRRRVQHLVRDAVVLGRRAEMPEAQFENAIDQERWWLHPYPREKVLAWQRFPLSITICAFWISLGLACLRIVFLGLHSLAFEAEGWLPVFFFLFSTGCTGLIAALVWRWSQEPPERLDSGTGGIDSQRRRLLHVCGSFGIGVLLGSIVFRLFRPMPIGEVAAKIAALRPGKPNGSPVFDARRRLHTAVPLNLPGESDEASEGESLPLPDRPSGMFVQNGNRVTVHYIFPRAAYGENRPKGFRRRGPRTHRPNPAPSENRFIRWGKPPEKWGAIVATPDALLLGKQWRVDTVPHVALNAAASSFEHCILHHAVAKGDLDLAIKLGLAAIRHDLIQRRRQPNFRIYDLTAGLMVRVGNRDSLIQLARLIQESPTRGPLFASRIAKWLEPENKWSLGWKKKVAIVWANFLISPDLLM